jgi:hypothetical protein
MSLKINKDEAVELIRKEAAAGPLSAKWVEKIEHLSQLCEAGVSKTHIAFFGTAVLAKAMNRKADLFAIKPEHAPDNPNAFSARTLCHSVLVPLAAEVGMSLGVSGREPLNNQPYFRMTRLDDGTPVHAGGRAAFDYMVGLVRELQSLADEKSARKVLRAFIAVRRNYLLRYLDFDGTVSATTDSLLSAIKSFVNDDIDGGKRAQAIVAGLLDVFAGKERVESGRINDPSRNYPGDVCVRSESVTTLWEKAFEVRNKPVSDSDIQIFGKKCAEMGVRECALVMVYEKQKPLGTEALNKWARKFGISLTLFVGWDEFVDQVLFWAELPKPVAAERAAESIYERLVAVEASTKALALWNSLISKGEA